MAHSWSFPGPDVLGLRTQRVLPVHRRAWIAPQSLPLVGCCCWIGLIGNPFYPEGQLLLYLFLVVGLLQPFYTCRSDPWASVGSWWVFPLGIFLNHAQLGGCSWKCWWRHHHSHLLSHCTFPSTYLSRLLVSPLFAWIKTEGNLGAEEPCYS